MNARHHDAHRSPRSLHASARARRDTVKRTTPATTHMMRTMRLMPLMPHRASAPAPTASPKP